MHDPGSSARTTTSKPSLRSRSITQLRSPAASCTSIAIWRVRLQNPVAVPQELQRAPLDVALAEVDPVEAVLVDQLFGGDERDAVGVGEACASGCARVSPPNELVHDRDPPLDAVEARELLDGAASDAAGLDGNDADVGPRRRRHVAKYPRLADSAHAHREDYVIG